MRYHRPRGACQYNLAQSWAWKAHIVEDIKIGIARVSSSHDGAIVGNLDSVVECIQVDAIQDETGHLGGCKLAGAKW
jgi:hypothetical protein